MFFEWKLPGHHSYSNNDSFRAVCLKFNELHLLLKWTLITHELLSTFDNLLAKSAKELSTLSQDSLQLIFLAVSY